MHFIFVERQDEKCSLGVQSNLQEGAKDTFRTPTNSMANGARSMEAENMLLTLMTLGVVQIEALAV